MATAMTVAELAGSDEVRQWLSDRLLLVRRRYPELDPAAAHRVTERWARTDFEQMVTAVLTGEPYHMTPNGLLAGLDAACAAAYGA